MEKNQVMRKLPKVAELLNQPEISLLCEKKGRNRVTDAIRESIDIVRQNLVKELKKSDYIETDAKDLMRQIMSYTMEKLSSSPYTLRPIINATGVVLHTNLGRAPLPQTALDRILKIAGSYSNLEYDIKKGGRGERYDHVRVLLCQITGAEDVLVVNNNAAAVLLCLSAIASGKEVIISRGQLVEIGGSFRVPDVMAQSGARLVEVGTTNKTYLRDYENAINEDTGMLLKVHTSNFKVIGFTSNVNNTELSSLGKKYKIPVMEDLGSGILVDLTPYGFPYEPTVSDSLKAGMDLVTFSGDKLLGGPQAGIIVGKRELISRIKSHPLTRAVRVDKMTLAALEAVLLFYKDGYWDEIPTIHMLTRSLQILEEQARLLHKGLTDIIGDKGQVKIIDDISETGGGSFPGHEMPTKAVTMEINEISAQKISERLREVPIPVIGRIKKDKFLLDVRTMTDEDIMKTIEMVGKLI
ncbi:MAG TPA: L-seryl-tRNA(Sec) selenium transferase [Thermoanaerobacterales bacterium]|nr:L-seryl-tRNA(Sec) selenium transferase [Thermoanaerobacterales bacterium]